MDSSLPESGSATNSALLAQARERVAQRIMLAYALTGLFFMLLPGTFLGVWNLISISSKERSGTVSAAWIQAHGHAQIFGWIGTFIMGIGFYSIPKMTGAGAVFARRAWTALLLWGPATLLRWAAGVYSWHWRIALPLSAAAQLCAFMLFFSSVRQHPPTSKSTPARGGRTWISAVLAGTAGFGIGLLMNLAAAFYVSFRAESPVFPASFDGRYLALLTFGFIVPTIWGFSARWLPVFLGLKSIHGRGLFSALVLAVGGVALAQAGMLRIAPWAFAMAAVVSILALRLFERPERPAKIVGVHRSFPVFVRLAYSWLLAASMLGICAAYLDRANGWTGASRHALTVGFVATMVFAIGQRVLPAFAGMKVLYSPRLMFVCLLLLNLGCLLRVSSEILAYEGYWTRAWLVLPVSALLELSGVTIFALNLVLTFRQPPAHLMKPVSAA